MTAEVHLALQTIAEMTDEGFGRPMQPPPIHVRKIINKMVEAGDFRRILGPERGNVPLYEVEQ